MVAALLLAAAPAQAKLTFERQDGTVIRSSAQPRVWCGAWSSDVDVPALHVGLLRRSGGFFWHLGVVRRDLRKGRAFTFPHSFLGDKPTGAQLFAADGRNELSTAEEESSGRLFFPRISCRPGHAVSFRIDATLGSELHDLPTISVSGRFRGRVGTRPAPVP